MVWQENKKASPIRPTDDEARGLARKLIDDAKFAALGFSEPESGQPLVSRVAVAVDGGGAVVVLASDLSGHSRALANDPRASLLLGEPGKGDPLAHPRITVIGVMERIDRASSDHGELRPVWLRRHPKAELYIDFADFRFYRLRATRALLNGGFGKAYELTAGDLAR